MNDLVGIIRKRREIHEALASSTSSGAVCRTSPSRAAGVYNPGWHLAIDMRNMLLVSECVAKAALQRTESRGGHTRDDYPAMDANWRNTLLVCTPPRRDRRAVVPDVTVTREDQVPMRPDLLEAVELSELEKYYTDAELTDHPATEGLTWLL